MVKQVVLKVNKIDSLLYHLEQDLTDHLKLESINDQKTHVVTKNAIRSNSLSRGRTR